MIRKRQFIILLILAVTAGMFFSGIVFPGTAEAATYTWQDLRGPGDGSSEDLVCDPSTNTLYRATYTRGVWKYQLGEWSQISDGLQLAESLAYDSAHDILFVIADSEIWRCNNPGTAPLWEDISGSLSSNTIDIITYDPSRDLLYGSGWGHGVWRCSDPGGTPVWTEITGSLPGTTSWSITCDPVNNLLYLGTHIDGLWCCSTPDSTPTWTNTGGDFTDHHAYSLSCDHSSNILYASNTYGVWRCVTPNTTPTWTNMMTSSTECLAYDSVHDILYAGNYNYAWRCENPGSSTTWDNITGPLIFRSANVLTCDETNDLLYAGGNAVWKCNNPRTTATWENTAGGVSNMVIDCMAYDSVNDILYAGEYVYRCTNMTTDPTWESLGIPESGTKVLVYDSGNNILFTGGYYGIYLCENPGTFPSFTKITTGLNLDFISMAYDSAHDVLYAASDEARMWRCQNPLTNPQWADIGTDLNSGNMYSIAYDSLHDILFAGSNEGVFRCTSPRGTPFWTQMSTGDCEYCNGFAYDDSNNILYAYFNSNINRCVNPDSSSSWVDVGNSISSTSGSSLIYDSSHNVLYQGARYGIERCDNPYIDPSWSADITSGTEIYGCESIAYDPSRHVLISGTEVVTQGKGVWYATSVGDQIVNTTDATSITTTEATLNADLVDIDGVNADSRGFRYWSSSIITWTEEGSFGTGTFSHPISGLDPDTTYNVQAFTHSSEGYNYGDIMQFDTVGPPVVETSVAGGITDTTANLNGNITDTNGENADLRGVQFREQGTTPWTQLEETGSFGTGTFNQPASGLDSGATYEFQAYAHNSGGTTYGSIETFTTIEPAVVQTNEATSIGHDSAILNGEITDTGGENASTRGFRYREQGSSTWSDIHSDGSFGTGAFSRTVTGLDVNTKYEFEAYSTNCAGESCGDTLTFETVVIPGTVRTDAASGVAGTGATLNGSITDTGGENATTRGFEYRAIGSSGWTDWHQAGSYGTGDYSHGISGLTAGKTYEFRAYSTNSEGTSYGEILAFDTRVSCYYLAEGTTDYGFSTYITIQNPNKSEVTVNVTYMTKSGPKTRAPIVLPAESQTVINPVNDIGATDFSTKVESADGETIAVDRRMIWQGAGAPSQDGHASVGVTAPAETWYLAEGSSKWGFETWLLVQNPNGTEANCTITYMTASDGPIPVNVLVPANSRASYNMETHIGQKDASIKVESNLPIIPERAMYRNSRREGHDSIGTTTPAEDYYLAEGTTDWGFTTYVLVQNPNSQQNTINITYMTPTGPVVNPPVTVAPNSRQTICVNDYLLKQDCSIRVSGSLPLIAERAMYWGAGTALGEACHDSIGMSEAHSAFYLPDGETYNGTETWTLVQNPNSNAVDVRITYMTPGGAGNESWVENIPANSRKSFNMGDKIPAGRAAIMVECKTEGKKIMVERAMYWNSRGAGTDTIGGYSD